MPEAFTEDRIVSMDEAARLTSLSRGSIYRLEEASSFPRRIQLTGTRHGYSHNELQEWIAARKAASRDA